MGKALFASLAFTLLLFLSVMMIPVFGVLAGVFTPLPTLLVYYRWGSPWGLWVPAGSVLLGYGLLAYLSLSQSLPLLIEMLLLGLLLGLGMRRGWSPERTVCVAGLSVFAFGVLVFWFNYESGFRGSGAQVEQDLRDAVALIIQQYGGTSSDKQVIEETVQKMLPFLLKLLPGAALSTTIMACWLNLLAAKRLCLLHQVPLPSWQEWSLWKAPDFLVWVAIAGGLMLLLPFGSSRIAGLNIIMVIGAVYLLQGLAIIGFYFERWKLPRILRAFLYGIILIQQFFTLGAMLLGLFDMWVDFRRLWRSPAASA